MAGALHLARGRSQHRAEDIHDEADALRWLSGIETDLARGDWHDPHLGAVIFTDLAAQWLLVKGPKLRASTEHAYRYMLRVHISPTFGNARSARSRQR